MVHCYLWMHQLHTLYVNVSNSCNMGVRDLPDMYAQSLMFSFDPPMQNDTYSRRQNKVYVPYL